MVFEVNMKRKKLTMGKMIIIDSCNLIFKCF